MIWAFAGLLSVAILMSCAALGRAAAARPPETGSAAVVAIGSSLLRYSIPPRGSAQQSLLGDGAEHVRLALDQITETEQMELLGKALSSRAKTILLEVNPLVFDFRDQTPERHASRSLSERLGAWQRRLGEWVRSGLKNLLGATQTPLALTEAPSLNQPNRISSAKLAALYPLSLHRPREEGTLQTMIAQAKRQGATIVLICPPRSQTAAEFMGPIAAETLRAHIQATADRLGLPLFAPAFAWPDTYFIDQGHMNWQGRRKFMGELANWWARRG
ncbi:hypothetical protein [Alsobacter metallidurans]|uniref:hypothetical protein n=1 Tax=Alsobacter metallidurans TaxID=340221 RepID=UPI0016654F7E|nr:hypothetical protein [Alsobacter metallidurans]